MSANAICIQTLAILCDISLVMPGYTSSECPQEQGGVCQIILSPKSSKCLSLNKSTSGPVVAYDEVDIRAMEDSP